MSEKEDLFWFEKALEAFWKDYGKPVNVNAKHTCVNVHPKFIVGNRVNPEVARKIMAVYLSQLNSDRVVNEEIVISNDSVKIFDDGKLIMEVTSRSLVDSISNEVTNDIGRELSMKQKAGGEGAYIGEKQDNVYTFGEIRQALTEFLIDSSKNDSKNLLKEAVLLLAK